MPEILELLEKQNRAFAKFKKANNDRLDEIEAKGGADPLLEEKVDKANNAISEIEAQIKDLSIKALRPGTTGEEISEDVVKHAKAYGVFLRKGNDDGLIDLEKKALNVTIDADGGFAVPEEIDRNVLQLLKDVSPMRSVCNTIQVGKSDYKKLASIGGASSGWVDEDDHRTMTDTPQLAALTPYMGEIYASPAATQTMLDDAFFNVESWLADEVSREFAEKEALAFLSGDGLKKPKGILNYPSVITPDATRAFGQLQHMVTASATGITGDELIDMVYMLKQAYRTSAAWMANSMTLKSIRKLKDSTGNYLWSPGLQTGQPSNLLGYNVVENEDMDDISPGKASVMFGNFKRGYTIVDKIGIRVLRDPFTYKPYVLFYTTKRVGGMLEDSNAIKILQQQDGQ